MTKVYLVKTGFFSSYIWMTWESWPIKKAEHQRIDAFKLWFWRRLLRVPWTARSNQSILKEISPEYSLEGLMLKLQYFGHLMWRADSLKTVLILGKTEAGGEWENRGWDVWMVPLTQWIWVWANSSDGEGRGSLACCSPWVSKSWTWLRNWKTTINC